MPDTLENIKEMFDEASIDQKNVFLFGALINLHKDMQEGFKSGRQARQDIINSVNSGFADLKKSCDCRQKKCDNNFVTKKQSKVFGIMILVFSFGIGLGAGWITFYEAFKYAAPMIP
uniref:Uncharacterized protein n=1 Tax=viral metagenome TaxID=1070528 RepID=A0A6M3IDZ8_9ZZZZ